MTDRDAAVGLHSRRFGVSPRRGNPARAGFAMQDPQLTSVRSLNPGGQDRIRPFGVDASDRRDIENTVRRFPEERLPLAAPRAVNHGRAARDRGWVRKLDGLRAQWRPATEDDPGAE